MSSVKITLKAMTGSINARFAASSLIKETMRSSMLAMNIMTGRAVRTNRFRLGLSNKGTSYAKLDINIF